MMIWHFITSDFQNLDKDLNLQRSYIKMIIMETTKEFNKTDVLEAVKDFLKQMYEKQTSEANLQSDIGYGLEVELLPRRNGHVSQ